MNYTDLTTHIEDICENSFTAAQLALFVTQAEQKIRNMVQFPALRKTCEGATTGDVPYLSVPSDFVYMHSLSLRDDNGDHNYLIQVDPNFILEAYPDPTTTGQPQYYGHFDADSLILGPTPTKSWLVRITYGWYPESIVTAGTTWLGDNFDTALLNGALVEALRFMKGEPDLVAMYDKMYMEAITLLKMLGDGKLRQDSYRSGQIRVPVS